MRPMPSTVRSDLDDPAWRMHDLWMWATNDEASFSHHYDVASSLSADHLWTLFSWLRTDPNQAHYHIPSYASYRMLPIAVHSLWDGFVTKLFLHVYGHLSHMYLRPHETPSHSNHASYRMSPGTLQALWDGINFDSHAGADRDLPNLHLRPNEANCDRPSTIYYPPSSRRGRRLRWSSSLRYGPLSPANQPGNDDPTRRQVSQLQMRTNQTLHYEAPAA
ncbi:hypothetical protein CC1G_15484 [Coprinopsis cinerea okayama7|uniref:Uncharacterized protein n=1 Tax=Coprinopsis cinerea (strain Okayama-7 / 130 / ATCC MYA-4618 / FGSC 9003) TaxID=240176 RepID=D6RQW8_COPC7|nr:hypothetical protein CC1G_15484 [Coprinopsis cinerea okayama7\|eukprot:XP_002910207.1 hypothetical protein CC1G_15484 [Coprinopsis cinerea okayama7\